MSKEVNAAIGTQRQFAKQPELPYALRLDPLRASAGISQRTDYDAQLLAKSLGVVGTGFLNLNAAIEKGKQENATLINADKILAGKTKEDLQKFDRMAALQNVEGHNMSHNKYAMAALEQGIGKMASTYAKQEWSGLPESQKPKSVAEAVQKYNEILQNNYEQFGDGIQNRTAFDKGYYDGAMKDTMKVADEADARIDDDKRQKMIMLASSEIQDLVFQGVQGQDFSDALGMSLRKLQLGTRDRAEFMKTLTPLAQMVTEKDFTTERLNAFGDYAYDEDSKVRDMINLYPYYKKIAQNFDYRVTDDIYDKAKRPDGTLDLQLANKLLGEMPNEFVLGDGGIPNHMLPIAGGDLENITPEMKGVLGLIGGAVQSLGYANAQFTSGYRSPEHNASVNGAKNSYHIYGDAVDIDLGVDNMSEDDNDKLKSYFGQWFNEVLFHDAGSGQHLHLGGYKGGMQGANPKESSAAIYSPNRRRAVWNNLMAKHNDATRIKRQQLKDLQDEVTMSVITTDSQAEAINTVKNSGLPAKTQQQMINAINRKWRQEAKGDMSLDQQVWYNYEKGKGKGSLADDWKIKMEYEAALQNPDYDEDAFEKLQEKADIAVDRINRYWEFSSGGAYKYSELRKAVEGALDSKETTENKVDQEEFNTRVQQARQWVKANEDIYSKDKLEAHLQSVASQSGMSDQLDEFLKAVFAP